MPEKQTLLKDKPYEFVPLLESCRREDYDSQQIREKCTYSGKLSLKITVKNPLHIGSGMQDYYDDGNVIKKQMRRNDKIVIPGSSLKGVVRSVAEAVSYSCAVKVPDEIVKGILPAGNKKSCSGDGKLCMTCFMFGMTSDAGNRKGRVQFGEFYMESGRMVEVEIPALYSPFQNNPKGHDKFNSTKKCSYGNERLYYCKACKNGDCETCTEDEYYEKRRTAGKDREMGFRGRKFYSTGKEVKLNSSRTTRYEMIAPNSVLKGEIVFQNLRQEEGRLLAYALDIMHTFRIKMGYGKPLGYGKVEIDLEKAESLGDRYSTVSGIDKELIQRWAQEYKTQNTKEIKDVIKKLERIMGNGKRYRITSSY